MKVKGRGKLQVGKCSRCGQEILLIRKPVKDPFCWECSIYVTNEKYYGNINK